MTQAQLRGSTGPLAAPGGNATIAWPAGTVAGDLALLRDTSRGDEPRGPVTSGWQYLDAHVWCKRVTTEDLAADLGVGGVVTTLLTFQSAGGVDRVRFGPRVWSWAGGASAHFAYIGSRYSGNIASQTYQRGTTVTNPDTFFRHAAYARSTTTDRYLQPGSEHSASEWVSIEVLTVKPPAAPSWLSPTSGTTVDRAQSVRLSWRHNTASGLGQDKAKVLIREVGTSTWFYVQSDGALISTATELTQADEWINVAAGALTAGKQYETQVLTHDDGGWSPNSVFSQITARSAPTVVVTLTTGANDLTPTVAWTVTPGYGFQRAWELVITDGSATGTANPLVTVSLTAGTQTSWTATPADTAPGGVLVFSNGQSIKAWVRVVDSALPSVWTSSSPATVSWTAPAVPAAVTVSDARPLTVTVTGIPALSVRLSVEWETSAGNWEQVIPAIDGAVSTAVIEVPHAPYGVARRYRVASWQVIDGVKVPSAYVTSDQVASTDIGAYLVSSDGAEWLPVMLPAGADTERRIVQGVSVSYGLSRPNDSAVSVARVDRTPVAGEAGSLSLLAHNSADLALLRNWVTSRDRWLMCWPPERDDVGVLQATAPTPMSAASETNHARRVSVNVQLREVRFDWVQSRENN